MKIISNIFTFLIAILIVTACAPAATQANKSTTTIENTSMPLITPTNTVIPTATLIPTLTPTPIPPNHPGWMPEGAIARFGMGIYRSMAVSPDNSIVAVAATSGVYFIDPLIGRTIDFLETGADAQDVAFSPDGKRVYIGMGIEGVAIWFHDEANSWKQEEVFPYPCAYSVAISPNGETLFTKCHNGANSKFVAWDLASKTQRYQSNYAQAQTSFAMAFSPANSDLMAVAANQTVKLMEVKSGKTIKTYYEPNKNKVVDLDFSPDGSILAIVSESPEVILLNPESAEEIGRTKHNSNVLQLSFIDNKTIAAFMEKSSIIEDVSGKLIKNLNRSLNEWSRIQVYVPENNLIVIGDGAAIVSISLKNYAVISEVDGFYRYFMSYSGNGNAFRWGDLLMYSEDFSKQTHLDIYSLCGSPRHLGFADNDGKYISVSCDKDKIVTVEAKTMKVVSSFPLPLTYTSNTFVAEHPWSDERELLALMYENSNSSPAKYRIEIWNPIQNKKISTLDVDIHEFQLPDVGSARFVISPHSKYLVVLPPDGKTILSYRIDSGALIQNIKLNTPRPLHAGIDEGMFLDGDELFFIRHDNFIEAYSVESGELIQKISGLQLIKWNLCEGLCLPDKNNFAYFSETKSFVNYNYVHGGDKFSLNFNFYDIESGKKVSSSSIQMPFKLKSGEKVGMGKYSLMIDYVYLPPEKNGNVAVVGVRLDPVGNKQLYDSTIYVVDISTNTILKNYTWQHTNWSTRSFAYKNLFLFFLHDPVYFLFDISTP
jgi:WD40 repeat protein